MFISEGVHTSFLLGYQSCLESLSRECEVEMEKCRVSAGSHFSSGSLFRMYVCFKTSST